MELTNTDALILIDLQNDFCKDGALAVGDANAILNDINFLSLRFLIKDALLVATQDWHPRNHKSFASTHGAAPFSTTKLPYGEQTLWPDHCVEGSKGAEFHRDVDGAILRSAVIVRKGMNPEIDSYSAFYENDQTTKTGLAGYLRDRGIKRCFFVGLAYDFCVGFSALDAVREGFEAVIIKDLTKPIAMHVASGLGSVTTTVNVMERKFRVAGVQIINQGVFYPAKQPVA
jgi:nicotinamidase/pyrazinamidase